MIILKSYKAAPTIKNEPVESLTIIFDREFDDYSHVRPERRLGLARVDHGAHGHALEQVLFKVLPGGTYDQLLSRMLERKASLLRVPHGGGE